VTLAPDVLAAAVNTATVGWDPARRALLWAELRKQALMQSPGALAVGLDPQTVQTPALELIDRALIDADSGEQTRVCISLPPQQGKTTRAARYGSLWALLRNPDRRVAVASYAHGLAETHARFVRDLVDAYGQEGPRFGGENKLDLRLDPNSRAATRWDLHGHRGGMVATGIGGGLTGKPVDWLVVDDPHKDRADADSELQRGRVWDWWTDVALARGPRVVVVIMTRWHEDDLVGRILNEPDADQWRVINIPAQAVDGPDADPLGRDVGEYLLSARQGQNGSQPHDAAYFEERKRNARTWSALYQGNPTPAEGGIFQWDWVRPYRVTDAPALPRVVTAVDPTGGGHDEAGVVTAGKAGDGRTYVIGDRSGTYTAGGQWRHAWMAVLDHESDVLVYESNLVDPVMRRAIPSAWARMREQAQALRDAGGDVAAAALLVRGSDDDVTSGSVAMTSQLTQLIPYVDRILASPVQGPARVDGVRATRGKTTRAEPVSQAYETGQVSHVGVFPALEQQMVTWQEGQDSPDRVDALVWAWSYLNQHAQAQVRTPVGRARIQTGAGAAIGRPGRR